MEGVTTPCDVKDAEIAKLKKELEFAQARIKELEDRLMHASLSFANSEAGLERAKKKIAELEAKLGNPKNGQIHDRAMDL